ncbi:cytochrome c oxidase subunit II [Pigmentiphaga litoralis]|uniref:cytochrome c oxidase subunit II n=1 Tax=Pigmentiphaga litoralis TaxID=516702 RepID=UPI001E2D9DF5|nr:cytochrome c oxidase subunit II [Pigmentiphaga litoralis]
MLTPFAAHAAPAMQALEPAGVQATRIADLWHLTLLVCGGVFACVLAVLIIALLRAPRASADTRPLVVHGDASEKRPTRAVLWATAVSTVLLIGLVVADVVTERALSRLPVANALHVEMIGHQWWWETRYAADGDRPAFTGANELRVPVGRPVIVSLRSADVIHTFWVPSLHGKKDMIPGRPTTIEFRADAPGEFRGLCAEFCGEQHAMMAFSVKADAPDAFAAWADRQALPAPDPRKAAAAAAPSLPGAAPAAVPASDPRLADTARGLAVFFDKGCAQCHTIRGTHANGTLGPDLTHLASRPTLAAGTLANNRGNLAGWIVDANSLKPGVMMPINRLPPDDLQALLGYLETLQ